MVKRVFLPSRQLYRGCPVEYSSKQQMFLSSSSSTNAVEQGIVSHHATWQDLPALLPDMHVISPSYIPCATYIFLRHWKWRGVDGTPCISSLYLLTWNSIFQWWFLSFSLTETKRKTWEDLQDRVTQITPLSLPFHDSFCGSFFPFQKSKKVTRN